MTKTRIMFGCWNMRIIGVCKVEVELWNLKVNIDNETETQWTATYEAETGPWARFTGSWIRRSTTASLRALRQLIDRVWTELRCYLPVLTSDKKVYSPVFKPPVSILTWSAGLRAGGWVAQDGESAMLAETVSKIVLLLLVNLVSTVHTVYCKVSAGKQ